MRRSRSVVVILVLGSALGCSGHPLLWPRPAKPGSDGRLATPEEGKETIKRVAKLSREKFSRMTFAEFKAQVYHEPQELGGKYIVNGDTSILDEKHLQEFFDNEVKKDDQTFEDKGIKLVTDLKSFLYLCGTNLDFSDGLNGKGFHFINPNASRSCGCGESFSV